ncbi:hypothetical protein C3L33_03324, partial [Rhododendron williamsianum]
MMRLHWSEANVNLKPQLYVSVVIFEIVELLFNKELISFFIRYGLWREDLINHKSTSRLSAGVLCRETLRLEVFEKSMLNRAFLPQPVLNDWNFLMMRNISLASGLLGVIIDSGLENYASTLSVHPEVIDGRPGTLVIESFVVDVPEGNTKDETCYFVEALIKCNLKSLADVSERLAVQDRTEPIDRV